jgi:hypothetical protein
MPRFVLLYHDCPPSYGRASHWDLMLESGDVLRTWALECLPHDWQAARSRTSVVYPNCPSLAADNTVATMQLSDHRRDYLEKEGPLSGDRGTVMRVAVGTYCSEHESPGDWQVALTSDAFSATIRFTRSEADDEHWTAQSTEYQVPGFERQSPSTS